MRVIALPPLGINQYKYKDPKFSIDPTNSYLIVSDKRNAAITDAPCSVDYILAFLKEQGLTLTKILITHAHFEHIFALKELVERSGAEAYIHTLDKPSLTDNQANFTDFVGVLGYEPYIGKINELNHDDEIFLDEVRITVFHAPGHSPGSVYYMAENALFSGDVLSHNAVGHHNIPYANREDMLKTLKRTAAIEGDYNVYPAHWTVTTLAHEKKNNLSQLPCVYLSHSITLDS